MIRQRLRTLVYAGRARRAPLVRLYDGFRALGSAEGRARLWTALVHRRSIHQVAGTTWAERYPELFDWAARLRPDARRILSFGCSTGEELEALRRRFPGAAIVGADINPLARRIAAGRMQADKAVAVVAPGAIEGVFDIVFALAVLQSQRELVEDGGIEDLAPIYPFARFDGQLVKLVDLLAPGGLLCVTNSHYRVEDSSAARRLRPIAGAPLQEERTLFGCDGRRLAATQSQTLFEKPAG